MMKNALPWKPNKGPRTQSGVAMLTVIFMFAIATVIIANIIMKLDVDIDRHSSVMQHAQAWQYALSGEEWARQTLYEDILASREVDHRNEDWANTSEKFDVEGGYLEIEITDMQGLFNLNSLVNTEGIADVPAVNAFKRLLSVVEVEPALVSTLPNLLKDWQDKDHLSGTERDDYLSLEPSYRPPDDAMASISEMRLLKDLSKKEYQELRQKLFPFVTVLPRGTALNINTAPPEVIASLKNGVSLVNAKGIVDNIESYSKGISIAQFNNMMNWQNQSPPFTLDVKTGYFRVNVRARFLDTYAFLSSVLKRDPKNGEITLVSRDKGQRFIFYYSQGFVDSEPDIFDIDL
ncbi:MAG: type II secretion system minor pseudopilin GspK [Pseudomonadales bacterium]|nr:type II secretion system minor pseudopilin GspK [Pseudomonadales bacterium]